MVGMKVGQFAISKRSDCQILNNKQKQKNKNKHSKKKR